MVLVTGAAGFVGGRLVETLLGRGVPVRALVRTPTNGAPRHSYLKSGDVVVGDILDSAVARQAAAGTDVVYHCAAAVGNHHSKRHVYDVNLRGVKNLLEAVREVAPAARVVLLSSVNVLGTRDLDGATEDESCQYSGEPAADVKIEMERLALEYYRRGVAVTVVRPGFIYGPGDRHNLPKLISALRRGKFRYIGSRENAVPVVHVDDVVEAMLRAAAEPRAAGRVYHLTDGSRTTIGEFVETLSKLLQVPPPQKVLPYAVPAVACSVFEWLRRLGLRKQPSPVARNSLRFLGTSRHIDIRRAREEIGYSPQIRIGEGLAAALDWHLRNDDHGQHADADRR